MDALLTVLTWFGFTTLSGVIWNTAAYAAFYFIIKAVRKKHYINETFAICGLILGAYAWFFLGNLLLVTLQGLIFVSASLQWVKIPRRFGIIAMSLLTIAVYTWLVSKGVLVDIKALLGSFGLLGIAIGLMFLPSRHAFLVMAAGGALLIYYSFPSAMVFVFLNIFFAVANFQNWWKARVIKPAS